MSKLCFFSFFPCLNYSYNSSEAIKLENAHIIFVSPMIVLQLDLGLHVTVWIGVCIFTADAIVWLRCDRNFFTCKKFSNEFKASYY